MGAEKRASSPEPNQPSSPENLQEDSPVEVVALTPPPDPESAKEPEAESPPVVPEESPPSKPVVEEGRPESDGGEDVPGLAPAAPEVPREHRQPVWDEPVRVSREEAPPPLPREKKSRGQPYKKVRRIRVKKRKDGTLLISERGESPLPKAKKPRKSRVERVNDLVASRRKPISVEVKVQERGCKSVKLRQLKVYSNNRVSDLVKVIAKGELVDESKVSLLYRGLDLTDDPEARLGPDAGLRSGVELHALLEPAVATHGVRKNPRLQNGLEKYLSAHDVKVKPKAASNDFYDPEAFGSESENDFGLPQKPQTSDQCFATLKNLKADWKLRIECINQLDREFLGSKTFCGEHFKRLVKALSTQAQDKRSVVCREVCRATRRVIRHGAGLGVAFNALLSERLLDLMETLFAGSRVSIKAIANPCRDTLFCLVYTLPDQRFVLLDHIVKLVNDSPHVKVRELSEKFLEMLVDKADPSEMKPYHKFWAKSIAGAKQGIFDGHSKVREAAMRVLVKLHHIYPGNVTEIVQNLTRSQKKKFDQVERVLFADEK